MCAQICDCTQVHTPHSISFDLNSCQCTLNVCSGDPSCCTQGQAWDQSCVDLANHDPACP
jgi:hypothetical protein